MATVEDLEQQVQDLQKKSSTLEAKLRLRIAQDGGLEEAAGGDASVIENLRALKLDQELQGEVPFLLLIGFFESAIIRLGDKELAEKIQGLLADIPLESASYPARTQTVRAQLDEEYMNIWAAYGVEENAASKAVENSGFLVESDELEDEEKELLSEVIDGFQECEEALVGRMVLGEEEFSNRMAQRERFENIQSEMFVGLNQLGSDESALRKFMDKIQADANAIQNKIRSMSPAERAQFLENPPKEDEEAMMKMQCLQMLIGGGGGHGHSHNGQPCHGHGDHGHSHAAPSHGHSHDGQPCHGHGDHGHSHAAPAHSHSHSAPSHGHSHNGKPCHGHGH